MRRWACAGGKPFSTARFSKCEAMQGSIQTLVPDVLKSHEVDEVLS